MSARRPHERRWGDLRLNVWAGRNATLWHGYGYSLTLAFTPSRCLLRALHTSEAPRVYLPGVLRAVEAHPPERLHAMLKWTARGWHPFGLLDHLAGLARSPEICAAVAELSSACHPAPPAQIVQPLEFSACLTALRDEADRIIRAAYLAAGVRPHLLGDAGNWYRG